MSRSMLESLEHRRLMHGTPAITVSDAALVEGNAGQSAIVFTVALSRASSKRVSVDFATANGSALTGEDYVATRGTLSFAPGQRSKTVSVLLNGDTTVEQDETFSIKLSRASNAFIKDARAIGTIFNDDQAPPPVPDWPLPPPGEDDCNWGPYGCQ